MEYSCFDNAFKCIPVIYFFFRVFNRHKTLQAATGYFLFPRSAQLSKFIPVVDFTKGKLEPDFKVDEFSSIVPRKLLFILAGKALDEICASLKPALQNVRLSLRRVLPNLRQEITPELVPLKTPWISGVITRLCYTCLANAAPNITDFHICPV